MFLLHKCGFMLKRRGDVKLCKSIEWQCRNNHIIRHDPNCFVQLACVCVCVCVCAHMHRRVYCMSWGRAVDCSGRREDIWLPGSLPLDWSPLSSRKFKCPARHDVCVCISVCSWCVCVWDGANSTFPSAACFASLISTILISVPSCFYCDCETVSVLLCPWLMSLSFFAPTPLKRHTYVYPLICMCWQVVLVFLIDWWTIRLGSFSLVPPNQISNSWSPSFFLH